MNDVIQLLPDSIANQIAAGEVVQRPASVVKELLENAIDAGATRIQLVYRDAGKQLIQVVDNGKGMSANDAILCFERHATSKLKSAQDLFNLRTLGFRGEALASIAAVAQVELRTCAEGQEIGTRIEIEGSEIKKREAGSFPVGTNIMVKNLFFNIPVRRNFLKSTAVEVRHIMDEFTRQALAHPEITFVLHANDNPPNVLPAGTLKKRIHDHEGKSQADALIPCEFDDPAVKIKGYIGNETLAKKNRGGQFLFVNDRFVRVPSIHAMIQNAFQQIIKENEHPYYVLFLSVEPTEIDVNIHPTKTEIKFQNERQIGDAVWFAVRQALIEFNQTKKLDFSPNLLETNSLEGFGGEAAVVKSIIEEKYSDSPEWEEIQKRKKEVENQNNQTSRGYNSGNIHQLRKPNQFPRQNWESLYEGFLSSQPQPVENLSINFLEEQTSPTTLILQSKINQRPNKAENYPAKEEENPLIEPKLLKWGNYLLQLTSKGIYLFDITASLERIHFQQILEQASRNNVTQQLIFPVELELSLSQINLALAITETLLEFGFRFEQTGTTALNITAHPAELKPNEVSDVFLRIVNDSAETISDGSGIEVIPDYKKIIATQLAVKAAQNSSLNMVYLENLPERLLRLPDFDISPSGKKTTTLLTEFSLEKLLEGGITQWV